MRLSANCIVSMASGSANRIQRNHFHHSAGAGRFHGVSNWKDVLQVDAVRDEVTRIMTGVPEGIMTVLIEMGFDIGWSATLPISEVPVESNDVEQHRPGPPGTWQAQFVYDDATHIRARSTRNFYMVGRLHSGDELHLDLFAMCPGVPLGKLEGDVTKQHEVVFLRFGHPGEPIN